MNKEIKELLNIYEQAEKAIIRKAKEDLIRLRIIEMTGKTEGCIRATTLPNRIALQKDLASANEHTAVLMVDAIVRNADLRIKEGLMMVYTWEKSIEGTKELLPLHIYELREWLRSLL